MPKIDPLLNDVQARLHGRPVQETAGPAPSSDKQLADHIAARMAGAPADANLGDRFTPSDSGGTLTPGSAEEEARAKLEQLDDGSDILAALGDPADELHATAKRLLAAYVALVEIERKRAGQ
jgi:hypothetical protein